METTVVTTIKNKCGNLADSNNYRPILPLLLLYPSFLRLLFYTNARSSCTLVIISLDLNQSTLQYYVFIH